MYQKLLEMQNLLRNLRNVLQKKSLIENPTEQDLETVRWIAKEARETEIAIQHLKKAIGLAA